MLLAADGLSNTKIADQIPMDVKNVARWRRRFAERGHGGPARRGRDLALPDRADPQESGHQAASGPGRDVDNGSSHVAKATKAWLDEHPRFHFHHTPNHASWLNQVELFFSILARRLLKRGEFDSAEDLVAKIMAFTADYNQRATPFRWTYDGKPLKVA